MNYLSSIFDSILDLIHPTTSMSIITFLKMPQYVKDELMIKGRRMIGYWYDSYIYRGYEFRDFGGGIHTHCPWGAFENLDVLVLDYTGNNEFSDEYFHGMMSVLSGTQHDVINGLTKKDKQSINLVVISENPLDHRKFTKFGSIMRVDKFDVDAWIKRHES